MASRRSDLKRARRECASLLSALNLPTSCDLTALCGHLAAVRGRPLHLVPVAMNASQPCGLWVSASDADWIFYDADTTPAHQEHIILHEIGHMICCHRGGGHLDEDTATVFFPDIDPRLVRDMLGRTTYDDAQEQQAEVMAYLLADILRAPVERPSDDDVAGRIANSLNHSARPDQR
ncbi:MAG: ImmA/IrrE family metallo-endopeptidase [Actinomycetota bacterium]|nr:ImmA/IrrE family metallo-endopeptidase [Actinomycetota bacterium]